MTKYVVVIEQEGEFPLHTKSLREHGERVPRPATSGSTKVRVA